ncbi:MAG: DNA repair protein RecN [Deltaproteobacteria bacterium]|nr:DNA repair protein RecN [Deltaproteobacteria bacterium]MBN2673354.1 DNA repair protein RecN [Deltaproteobacteria bacterium]
MLSFLQIKNLVLIEEMSLSFSSGFNVLTGETGAGKSLIATSLDLLLGKRASSNLVRKGAAEAEVEGIFDIADEHDVKQRLIAAGLPADDELLIRRIIPADGRHRVFVNGKLASLSVLAELTDGLASVMGQHEQHHLFDPQHQLFLVDGYASHDALLAEMAETYRTYRDTQKTLEDLRNKEKDRSGRIDYLRFQLEELHHLSPNTGESEQLEQELGILKHQSTLLETTGRCASELYESDNSIFERLSQLSNALDAITRYDAALETDARQLAEATILIEDVARSLSAYSQNMDADPERLDDVQSRLEQLSRMSRKHGVSADDLPDFITSLDNELAALESYEHNEKRLVAETKKALESAMSCAKKLSTSRKKAALKLSKNISTELVDLSFEKAEFSTTIQFDEASLGADGADRAAFVVELNPGEGAHPLKQVASGGELSRIMLAVKRALAGVGPLGTYVFDEVDAGIGGAVANAVGKKLAYVAKHHQLICISHLPQIASMADAHFHISKTQKGNRTHTEVRRLESENRVTEISRMLGGDATNKKMLAAARELLKSSA